MQGQHTQGDVSESDKERAGSGLYQSQPNRDTLVVQEVLMKNWLVGAGLRESARSVGWQGGSHVAGTLAEEPPGRATDTKVWN